MKRPMDFESVIRSFLCFLLTKELMERTLKENERAWAFKDELML